MNQSSADSTRTHRRGSHARAPAWRLRRPFAGHQPPGGLDLGGLREPRCGRGGLAVRDVTRRRSTTTNPGAGIHEDRRHAPAGQDQAHRIGALFINYGGPGGDAVATTQAIAADLFGAVNDRFDLVAFDPRGVGESSAVDRLQGQPGDRRSLLGAVHDARESRHQRAGRQEQGLRQALRRRSTRSSCPTPPPPTSRVTWMRSAPCHGRQEAQLLRLLVRHVPRCDLLEPLPRQLPGDGARRPARRKPLHQQARGEPARAVGRLRARARPLLPGLRSGPGVRARSGAPIRGLPSMRSWRRPTCSRSRPTASPTTRGLSTAMRFSTRTILTLYSKGSWPLLARAPHRGRGGRRDDHPLPRRRCLGQQPRRHLRPGHRPLLHDRRHRAEVPARHRITFLDTGDNSWGMFEPLLVQLGVRRVQLRALARSTTRTPIRARSPRSEVGTDRARGRDDV